MSSARTRLARLAGHLAEPCNVLPPQNLSPWSVAAGKGKSVTIFGATGGCGRHFIELSLAEGCKVTALVRDPTKLGFTNHPQLTVMQGDATRYKDVRKALKGAEVVVTTLGFVALPELPMEQAFANILYAASRESMPPRCLMVTTIGVGGSSWGCKLSLSAVYPGGAKMIEDYERADRLVTETMTAALDEAMPRRISCVLIRPMVLIDGPGTGKPVPSLSPGMGPKGGPAIPRADVAKFLMECVEDKQWDGKAIQLST
eukprot:gnl/MRDRNA2_/MRDRNA2_78437_c0_seq1.p1 gnl/MRDRNA2_/MRDRNA2_78437_c0~~gnl/MRDRNA2_/MRDRNA2_78437_c0_seq1.p1  ORF type:complete len:258 (-),score=40.36 gnl/MRDRNA2_/MRDRNA2_78437_c0_seq1:153-926(-)